MKNVLQEGLRKKKVVQFKYDDKIRIVEVHAIGDSVKDGSLVMRGFQIGGEASRPLPQWTLFTVSKISEPQVLEAINSLAPREGYTERDKQMSKIIAEIKL
jgi:hypothetical protein